VPKGKRIELGENIDRIEVGVSGEQNFEFNTYSNTTWVAQENRMFCLGCKPAPKIIHYR
jgi:hypothetical protein